MFEIRDLSLIMTVFDINDKRSEKPLPLSQ